MKIVKQWFFLCGLVTIVACANKKEKAAVVVKPESAKISNAWRSFNVSTLKVDASGVGKFKIGNTLPTQFSPLKKEEKNIIKKIEGSFKTIKTDIISSEGKILFAVNKDDDQKVDEITLYSPQIKTVENIGVGNTIAEFIRAYPDAKVWYTYFSDRVVLESPSLGDLQFILDKSAYMNGTISYNSNKEDLSISDFKENTIIKSIRIF